MFFGEVSGKRKEEQRRLRKLEKRGCRVTETLRSSIIISGLCQGQLGARPVTPPQKTPGPWAGDGSQGDADRLRRPLTGSRPGVASAGLPAPPRRLWARAPRPPPRRPYPARSCRLPAVGRPQQRRLLQRRAPSPFRTQDRHLAAGAAAAAEAAATQASAPAAQAACSHLEPVRRARRHPTLPPPPPRPRATPSRPHTSLLRSAPRARVAGAAPRARASSPAPHSALSGGRLKPPTPDPESGFPRACAARAPR